MLADGPLTNTQIAHTLQLPNDLLGPGPSPAVRGPQMNLPRPTQPTQGQVGRAPQTVGSQANHTQVPQVLQQQTGLPGPPAISQHLPTQSQVIVMFPVRSWNLLAFLKVTVRVQILKSRSLCPSYIFSTAKLVVTKLGVLMYHDRMEHCARCFGGYVQGQGHIV